MAIEPYKITKKETIFKHKYFELIKDEIETASGHKGEYFYHTSNDGVHVVGIDDDKQNLILTRQYRHPIKQIEIDVAGGILEDGETIKEAAMREFREETGYTGGELIKLGKIAVATGKADFWLYEFLLVDAVKETIPNNPEVGEETEVFILPITEAWEFIKSNKIASPHSISTIVKTLLYLEINPQ